jgi:hypothetical protein
MAATQYTIKLDWGKMKGPGTAVKTMGSYPTLAFAARAADNFNALYGACGAFAVVTKLTK